MPRGWHGMGIALRARADVRLVGGAVAHEHLARHAGRERVLHRVARTERRLRPRRAMQRRYRHRRRVSHGGRERRPDEDLRAHAGVGVLLRRQRVRGRRQDGGLGVFRLVCDARGALDDDRPIIRSGRRRRRLAQRLDQLGLRQVQVVRDGQEAGLASGIVDGLGRHVRRGRRRRRELHRLDDGVPGRLELEHFPVVELVLDRRPHQRRRGDVLGRRAGVVRGRGPIAGGGRGPRRRGFGARRPAGRIRIGRRSLSHRRPSFHSDTVLALSQGARDRICQVPLALCTTDTRFNVRNPAFEQSGGRSPADFWAPKRKSARPRHTLGRALLGCRRHPSGAAAGRPAVLAAVPTTLGASSGSSGGGAGRNHRLSCITVFETAVPPSTRQFAVMSCLPPATRSRSESDSSPSAAA